MPQKFAACVRHEFTNGAIGWRSGGMSDCLGPYAKVQNCPVHGTDLRLTCYATGYADTYFSVPADTRYRGKRITGYFTPIDREDGDATTHDAIEFRPHTEQAAHLRTNGADTMHATEPTMLDCGHLSTPRGLAAGYATRSDDTRICYACADTSEREALKTADRFTAYLSNGPQGDQTHYQLTTWTGGTLARVTSLNRGNHNIGGFLYRFRAVDVHGGYWYGTSPGPGMYARMRRAKSAK